MAKAKDSIWLAELDRFGYTLRVVGRTKEEARDALIKEYVKTYKEWNGIHPKKDIFYGDRSYYDSAVDEICPLELQFGEVDWT